MPTLYPARPNNLGSSAIGQDLILGVSLADRFLGLNATDPFLG
jgi:hypothetical protein